MLYDVRALGSSAGALAIDLRRQVEAGDVEDVVVITRDADGQLDVVWSPQTSGQLAEIGVWLLAVVQNQLAQTHELPEEETCEEES